MLDLKEAAMEFLAQEHIAVVGVSRDPNQVANAIYRRLKETGHTVYAVNPNADTVEGDPCFHSLGALPVRPDGVMICTAPTVSETVARECVTLGIPRMWMHRSVGEGSYSEEAATVGRNAGIRVITAGCPMMFSGNVDVFHRCMRWMFTKTGKFRDVVHGPVEAVA